MGAMINIKTYLLGFLLIVAVSSHRYKDCLNVFDDIEHSLQRGDGGFQLFIRDKTGKMADKLIPDETYRIIIMNSMFNVHFTNFQIQTRLESDLKDNSTESIGRFLSTTGTTNIKECVGSVMGHKRAMHDLDLLWRAPKYPKGCIKFKLNVVMSPNLVYYNSYKLEKVLCPDLMLDNVNNTPVVHSGMMPSFKECCACGTASYKVVFKGLWNKTTHPTDWPQDKGHLHWTNPIGVTHDYNYMIYNLGRQASLPVQNLCATGDSTELKREFQSSAVKNSVKSLFTSAGMYGEDQLNEERIGYISVNRTHHLFSFLSMMGPSTDWCSGISSLDLCTNGCGWKGNMTLSLFPMDFGFKTGETYYPNITENLETPDPIREINKQWMKDSPFSNNKPVAEITLTRIMPSEDWKCTKQTIPEVQEFHNMTNQVYTQSGHKKGRSVLDDPILYQMSTFLCKLSEWSEWTPCSVSCGIGKQTRTRKMLLNNKNELCRHLDLTETRTCEGRKNICNFPKCGLLSWSSWSPCTATCDKPGRVVRTRSFVWENNKEECLKESHKKIELVQEKVCNVAPGERRCDPLAICSDGKDEGSKCKKGLRSRFFYDMKSGKCETFKYLGCKGSLNNFLSRELCENTCSTVIKNLPQWRRDQLMLLQSKTSSIDKKSHTKAIQLPNLCFLDVAYGHKCNNGTELIQWYFNSRMQRCRSFTYQGCMGNDNNFVTYTECMNTCMPQIKEDPNTKYTVDCTVSKWGPWGPCSVMCGEGQRFRWRNVIHADVNGGAPCPRLYETGKCFSKQC